MTTESNPTPGTGKADPRVVIGTIALLAAMVFVLFHRAPDAPSSKSPARTAERSRTRTGNVKGVVRGAAARPPLTDNAVAALAPMMKSLLAGQPVGPTANELSDPHDTAAWVVLRQDGRAVSRLWRKGSSISDALQGAVQQAKARLGDGALASVNEVELNLAHSFREHGGKVGGGKTSNKYRGLLGIEFISGDKLLRYAPTYAVETNKRFTHLRDDAARSFGLTNDQMSSPEVSVRTFEADQVIVSLAEPAATRLFRGDILIDVKDVTKPNLGELIGVQSGWMFNNMMADGRMTYLYEPSKGGEPEGDNNMIRQWMGTICMGRIAKRTGDAQQLDRVHTNIGYNLEHFYKEEPAEGGGTRGYIEFGGTVKLGAIALATLAIVEHPRRDAFKRQEEAMLRTIDEMFQDDGHFFGFLKPRMRDGAPNFYPGEALLLWSTLYKQNPDKVLLAKIMKAFEFYKPWHLKKENRKPSFTPWQTQAYHQVWELTKDDKLKDFIFTMNDWLIDEMLQWDDVRDMPDLMGRYYQPGNEWFGKPHAASTGVYLEGLISAHAVAKAAGDAVRQEKYRQGMVRGMRSMMQLTFRNDVELFYVEDRNRVRGGVRSRTYANGIRVDNVQHGLMGMMRIYDAFADADYRP